MRKSLELSAKVPGCSPMWSYLDGCDEYAEEPSQSTRTDGHPETKIHLKAIHVAIADVAIDKVGVFLVITGNDKESLRCTSPRVHLLASLV